MKKLRHLSNKNKQIDREFYETIRDILHHPAVQQMRIYMQHSGTNCYEHCLHVAYFNYRICRRLHLDARSAARAAMVHDLFLYDWRTHKFQTGDATHAFTHPRTAYNNAKRYFDFSEKEEEIITKHMWPVTIVPPKHPETYVIVFTDKFCGFCEFLDYYFGPLREEYRKINKL
ncbi:MAG: phosphohydrolase [Lachnospiraceae bacterium]|nr:phosphohydrolase [Lachnospiraceae bacterium]MDD3616255.1 phosphohydrolase [Lachnospiraceae bacterium]